MLKIRKKTETIPVFRHMDKLISLSLELAKKLRNIFQSLITSNISQMLHDPYTFVQFACLKVEGQLADAQLLTSLNIFSYHRCGIN